MKAVSQRWDMSFCKRHAKTSWTMHAINPNKMGSIAIIQLADWKADMSPQPLIRSWYILDSKLVRMTKGSYNKVFYHIKANAELSVSSVTSTTTKNFIHRWSLQSLDEHLDSHITSNQRSLLLASFRVCKGLMILISALA